MNAIMKLTVFPNEIQKNKKKNAQEQFSQLKIIFTKVFAQNKGQTRSEKGE